MIKKIFISFLVLIIISSNVVYSYKVSANSNPFVPPAIQGYDEALFTSFMAGVGAITAGAMHTTESINKMRDFAVDNWPALKESFSNALTWTGTQISIAGDWIEDMLMGTMINSDLNIPTGDFDITYDGSRFKAPNGMQFRYSYEGVTYTTNSLYIGVHHNKQFSLSYVYLRIGSIDTPRIYARDKVNEDSPRECTGGRDVHECWIDSYLKTFPNIYDSPSLASIAALVSRFGASVTLVYNDGSVVETENLYNQVDNWFRQREAYENGLTLGIPQSAPYTPTGRALQYDDVLGTLTLDGVPYTGEVDWKTLANLGLNIPAIPLWLADLPVFYLGDGVFVDQHGNVIPTDKVGDITVGYPDIVVDDTNVYVRTQTGDLVNLKTGEIVTTGELDVPSIPVVPTIPIEYSGEFATPTTTIDWNPLLMAGRGLTEKFPFSIPFDFYRQLQVFDVEPQAPEFKINLSNYFTIDGHQQSMNWELSFEQFDTIAAIFRWFILIVFDIGLILAIRRIMPE